MKTKQTSTGVGIGKSYYAESSISSSIVKVMDAVQEMEELGGPDYGDYVIALTLIKMDLDKRIKNATQAAVLNASKTLQNLGL